MSTILYQRVLPINGGNLVCTIVQSTALADTVTLPRMSGTAGKVAQLRRPGDAALTVSQTDATAVSITFTSVGQEILLVSHHLAPIPAPTGDGA